MSIFKKITLLFVVGLFLIFLIAYRIDSINMQKVEATITQKYLQDAKKIFSWLIMLSSDTIKKKVETLGLELLEESADKDWEVVLSQPHTFGKLEILQDDGNYFMKMKYFDDVLLLRDKQYQENLKEQWLLNLLLLFNVAILVMIFLIMLKILMPLRMITEKMKEFSHGKYQSRVDIQSKDEIGEVASTYNTMAEKLQGLIAAREELLRDIGHELRTPISKGYFAVDALPDSRQKEIIRKSFSELDRLSAELLEIERLHALDALETTVFRVESLILEALSKLMGEDESKIEIVVRENFVIKGDLGYLSTALKNLIDNALKYATAYPVAVIAEDSTVSVQNRGAALKNTIAYYLEPFTQEETRRGKGYGLGLNIVQKILQRHGWKLSYLYAEGFHRFSIVFDPQNEGDSSGEY